MTVYRLAGPDDCRSHACNDGDADDFARLYPVDRAALSDRSPAASPSLDYLKSSNKRAPLADDCCEY